MKILVVSCDKNADLFEPFHHCIEKYWPEHPEVIYCTETKTNPYYKTILKNYDISQWTRRVREAVQEIDDDFILLTIDDLFIRSEVNNDQIMNLLNYFDNNTAALNLEKSWDARDIRVDDNILVRSAQGSYKTSVMCSIYKKDKLLKILSAMNTDPWTFERSNTHLNFRYLITSSCQFIDWGWKNRKWFGVKQGKWCQEAVDFLTKENIGIDFNDRGIYGRSDKCAICCIAKNENKYINNWVNYHLNIGFSHIYIFDNNDSSTPYVGDYIEQKDKVTIFNKNNIHQQSFQLRCYQEFYDKYLNTFDWCAFIDVDEFISGVKDVRDWLSKLTDFESVRIKWKMFGDDDVIERDESIPVQDFFKKPLHNSISENGKAIVRGGIKDAVTGSCHYAFRGTRNYLEGLGGDRANIKLLKQCLPSGKPCNSRITIYEDYSQETIYLNHYMTKTLKEFIEQKFGRGDAIFERRDLNFDYYWRINTQTKEKLDYIDRVIHQKDRNHSKDAVDIVIPYVDSSDKNWQQLFEQYNPNKGQDLEEVNAVNRFRGQGDFFRYVFRSIQKNMPWIRKVFLLVQSESQVPHWINRNNVQVVLHKDFIPEQFLPTFNSTTIEMFLWNIPGLAERFIYSNDDIYFYNQLSPDHFFDADNNVKNNMKTIHYSELCAMYTKQCINGYGLVYGLDPTHLTVGKSVNHIARPYLKSAVKACFDEHKEEIYKRITPFREEKNVNVYIFDNYQVKIGKQVPRTNLLFAQINQKNDSSSQVRTILKEMQPQIVCINDIDSKENIYNNTDIRYYFSNKFSSSSKYEK